MTSTSKLYEVINNTFRFVGVVSDELEDGSTKTDLNMQHGGIPYVPATGEFVIDCHDQVRMWNGEKWCAISTPAIQYLDKQVSQGGRVNLLYDGQLKEGDEVIDINGGRFYVKNGRFQSVEYIEVVGTLENPIKSVYVYVTIPLVRLRGSKIYVANDEEVVTDPSGILFWWDGGFNRWRTVDAEFRRLHSAKDKGEQQKVKKDNNGLGTSWNPYLWDGSIDTEFPKCKMTVEGVHVFEDGEYIEDSNNILYKRVWGRWRRVPKIDFTATLSDTAKASDKDANAAKDDGEDKKEGFIIEVKGGWREKIRFSAMAAVLVAAGLVVMFVLIGLIDKCLENKAAQEYTDTIIEWRRAVNHE